MRLSPRAFLLLFIAGLLGVALWSLPSVAYAPEKGAWDLFKEGQEDEKNDKLEPAFLKYLRAVSKNNAGDSADTIAFHVQAGLVKLKLAQAPSADAAKKKQQLDAAEKQFNAALKLNSKHQQARTLLGLTQLQLQLKDYSPAVATLELAAQGDHPNREFALRLLVQAYALRESDKASYRAALERISPLAPREDESAELLYLLGYLHFKASLEPPAPQAGSQPAGELSQAGEYLDRCLKSGQPTEGMYRLAGMIYFQQGKLKESADAFGSLAAEFAEQATADDYCWRGLALRELNDVGLAEDAFRSALKINPKHQRTLRELVDLYLQENRYDEARKLLDGL